jgi:hypothetical protein
MTEPATNQLVEPSDIRDIPAGIISVWWTWLISLASLLLFVNASVNEWNFPWLPASAAIILFAYGVYRTMQHRNSKIQYYEYMLKYGLKRQATLFKCLLCGAIFHQPEGADLCPECYESGIIELDQ